MYTLMQSAREIKVALVGDGDRIGGLLNEKHPLPVEEGEPVFDYRQHMRALDNQLDVAVAGAAVAEDTHSDEQIRTSRLQQERDAVAGRGYGKLVSARQGLESVYERGGYELAFLSGATPKAPRRLCEQLGQTVKLLRRPAVERRGVKVQGFSVDFDAVADDLDAEEKDLRAALDGVDAVKKRAEGTMVVKNEALDVLRRTVIWVGRTTEGMFRLAGEDGLADRIRTATRRPSAGPEDEPAPDSPEPVPDSPAPEPPASAPQA
jgi:hypothetical protein